MIDEKQMLYVTSFGGFSISLYDCAVDACGPPLVTDDMGHSKKLWILLEYLLFSGKEKVGNDELIEVLWSEDDLPNDPMNSLRLLVHRVRSTLNRVAVYKGSDLIISGNETYRWNRQIPVIIDAERFETLYYSSLEGPPAKRLATIMSAIALSRGRFLPRASYQHWAMALSTYYESKYMDLCYQAVELLQPLSRPQDIIDICTKAVAIEPQNEYFHITLIEALASIGDFSGAVAHYKSVTNMLLKDFGVTPSEKMAAVFRTLSHNTEVMKSDIRDIRNSMTDPPVNGAFYCEYEIFRHIYNLKMREYLRNRQMVQLALITVFPSHGKNPGTQSRRNVMDRLGAVIRDTLRQGDSYTRYSVMQYLLLLQATNRENGLFVLKRIQQKFRLSGTQSGYLLQSTILPMLPKYPQQNAQK